VLDLAVSFFLIRRKIGPLTPRFDLAVWPTLVRGGLMYVATLVLNDIAFRLDTVFLGFWTADAQIGWYKAAYKIPEGLTEIHAVVAMTLLPALSVAHGQSREEVVQLYRRGAKLLVLAAAPLVAFVWLRADSVVQLAFGSEYREAAPVLQVLMLSLPGIFLTWLSCSVLWAIERPGAPLARSAVAVAINVVLNTLLIPRMGIMGAAIATAVTEGAAAALVVGYLFSHGYGFLWAGDLAKVLAATLAMVGVTLLTAGTSLLLAFPLAFAVYFVVLYGVRIWDEQERQMFMGVVGLFQRQRVAGSKA
jgi:O-antigen/teichoic acid export membrane protein